MNNTRACVCRGSKIYKILCYLSFNKDILSKLSLSENDLNFYTELNRFVENVKGSVTIIMPLKLSYIKTIDSLDVIKDYICLGIIGVPYHYIDKAIFKLEIGKMDLLLEDLTMIVPCISENTIFDNTVHVTEPDLGSTQEPQQEDQNNSDDSDIQSDEDI